MTFDHLTLLFSSWGFKVKPEHYFLFEGYLKNMLSRKRVMVIWDGVKIDAVILYFITNDYEKIYKKSTWQIVRDDSDGKQIYIDKMICRKWSRDVRDAVGRAIQTEFPDIELLVYHRAPKDRCVKINRRSKYEPVPSTVC